MRFVVTVTPVLPGPSLSCSTVFSEAIAQCDGQSSVAELASRSVSSTDQMARKRPPNVVIKLQGGGRLLVTLT